MIRFLSINHCLFSLFSLLCVCQSYAMLDFVKEVRNRYQSEQFVRDFPNMTLAQVNQKYVDCSPVVAMKIKSAVVAKKKQDDYFVKVFDIATQLPTTVHQEVVKQLFNGNDSATKKFLEMPIGKALEWHAWCQKASRGKMIFLPVFNGKFKEKNIDSCPLGCRVAFKLNKELCWQNRGGFPVNNGKRIASCDENRILARLGGYDELSGEELQSFLDLLAVDLFQLSKGDIVLLLNIREIGFNYASKKNLLQLLAIDKKVPFLDATPGDVSYFSYKPGGAVKNGIKTGMRYIFPLFAVPLSVIGLSRLIEANCCNKMALESIAQSNNDKSAINALIELSGNHQLLPYRFELLDATVYSWTDYFKMNIPFWLPIPAILCFERSYRKTFNDLLGDVIGISIPTAIVFVLSCFPTARSIKEFNALLSVAIGASIAIGIAQEWNEEFHDTIKSKKIAELLKIRGVSISQY